MNILVDGLKEATYKSFDLLTSGRGIKRTIGGSELRLPVRLSRFYSTDYEPETVVYLNQTLKPGDRFFDIGAHIGLFTVLGARLVRPEGQVISFEPTPVTRSALAEVVKLNKCTDVVSIRSEAVSRARGKAQFFDTGEAISVTNSLVRNETTSGRTEVDTISVDEFVGESDILPDCMKIDVEGAELDVLTGAINVLTSKRPKVRLSLHPPFHEDSSRTLGEIWNFLKDVQYEIDDVGVAKFDRNWFCSQPDFFDVNLAPVIRT